MPLPQASGEDLEALLHSELAEEAAKAEAMHKRLHNRSASQAAEWLRGGVKRANDSGQKAQARHLVDNVAKDYARLLKCVCLSPCLPQGPCRG